MKLELNEKLQVQASGFYHDLFSDELEPIQSAWHDSAEKAIADLEGIMWRYDLIQQRRSEQ